MLENRTKKFLEYVKEETTMARTKRARKSTRRKSTSTRRTSARRPKRTTKRRRSKGLGLTRKAQKKVLIVAAVVVGLLLLIALLQNPARTYVQKRWYGGEVSRHAVYGRVTSVAVGAFGRGAIHVQSFNTRKVYTFYVGRDTNYAPHRYPSPGENAKVYYIYDRGYLKATLVKIR
jgi:hypothetical protein